MSACTLQEYRILKHRNMCVRTFTDASDYFSSVLLLTISVCCQSRETFVVELHNPETWLLSPNIEGAYSRENFLQVQIVFIRSVARLSTGSRHSQISIKLPTHAWSHINLLAACVRNIILFVVSRCLRYICCAILLQHHLLCYTTI